MGVIVKIFKLWNFGEPDESFVKVYKERERENDCNIIYSDLIIMML